MKSINYISLFGFLPIFFLTSCKSDPTDTGIEFAPNMYYSIPYDPLSQMADFKNPNNPYGINMREPVPGTIARGQMPYHIPKDSFELAARTLKNPTQLTDEVLEEGKILYSRFCLHCHGETGQGDGLVGVVFKGISAYNKGRVKNLAEGHIFHTITKGKGRMESHASQLNPQERWKIVHYVQTLQKQ